MADQVLPAIAIACKIVGTGQKGKYHAARVSLVNEAGLCIYDRNVDHHFTDITPINGVRTEKWGKVRLDVAKYIKGCLLVGHGIAKCLKGLKLCHPDYNKRDTNDIHNFFEVGFKPTLSRLAVKLLGTKIQNRTDTIQVAQTTMKLYRTYKNNWEEWLDSDEDEEDGEEEEEEEEGEEEEYSDEEYDEEQSDEESESSSDYD